nr:hypothetical protein [Tanacetum cinerariifolium]
MIDNIDQDVEITLVDETQRRMNEEEMFGVNDLDSDEVIVDATASEEVEQSIKVSEKEVSTADQVTTTGEVITTTEDVEVTTAATILQISKDELKLAQTLIEIKLAKPKARGVGSTTRVESSEDKESLGDQEDASKQGRMIDNIDQDVEITLVDETQRRMNEEEMFGVNDLDSDEVIVDATASEEVEQSIKVSEKEVSTADQVTTTGEVITTTEDVEVTTAATILQISKDELKLAQTLIEIKLANPRQEG